MAGPVATLSFLLLKSTSVHGVLMASVFSRLRPCPYAQHITQSGGIGNRGNGALVLPSWIRPLVVLVIGLVSGPSDSQITVITWKPVHVKMALPAQEVSFRRKICFLLLLACA